MVFRSAFTLRQALRSGELSSLEATDYFLDRIGALNSDLGAFISVTEDLARSEARAADDRFARTPKSERLETLPRLHGMPTAYKDLTRVRGTVTTHGSAALDHDAGESDDLLPAALRSAGMVTLGKTQVPELGLTGYSENLIAPPARNPLDPSLTAGGSSGGSAAAVASGMLPVAPGSDAGGSVRIPAAACGIFGLKVGREALPASVWPMSDGRAFQGMGVAGSLAVSPLDAALLTDALRLDRSEPSVRAVQQAEELHGLHIGVTHASPFDSWRTEPLSPGINTALIYAKSRMLELGHAVDDATVSYPSAYPQHFTTVWTSALTALHVAPAREPDLTPLTRFFLEQARATPQAALDASVSWLHSFVEQVTGQWDAFDVIMMPTLATTPPRIGEFLESAPEDDYLLQCQFAPYTSMVNVIGRPAISVPLTAHEEAGIPASVQLVGKPGSEARLLQLAEQLAPTVVN